MSVITAYARLSAISLGGLRGNPDWLEVLDGGRIEGAASTDVDKAADGIIWLLQQLQDPKPYISMLSGESAREEPQLLSPYEEPARLLKEDQVREVASWLKAVDTAALRTAYEPEAMARAGVYPQIWMAQGAAAFEEYLLPHFVRLRDFLGEAASAGQCVIIYST